MGARLIDINSIYAVTTCLLIGSTSLASLAAERIEQSESSTFNNRPTSLSSDTNVTNRSTDLARSDQGANVIDSGRNSNSPSSDSISTETGGESNVTARRSRSKIFSSKDLLGGTDLLSSTNPLSTADVTGDTKGGNTFNRSSIQSSTKPPVVNGKKTKDSNIVDKKSNLVRRQKRQLLVVTKINDVSWSTQALAESLEVWNMLLELYKKDPAPTTDRKVWLRREIRETLLQSYFDAAAVEAEAEREYVELDAIRQELILDTEKRLGRNNAANFIISGSLNTIGGSMSFTDAIPSFPSNFLQMMSGVVSTGMSAYALKQASGSRIYGLDEPTVLAELFGRPTDERSSYPESVWRFFHSPSVEDTHLTRAQRLEQLWIKRHHIEPHGAKDEQLKIDLICGIKKDKKLMTVDDLSDNIAMISDVSETAARMTHHLRDLLHLIDTDLTPD